MSKEDTLTQFRRHTMLVKDGEVWSLCMVEWSKVPGHLDGQEVTQDDRLKDISGQ